MTSFKQIRHFEFLKSDVKFEIHDPKNIFLVAECADKVNTLNIVRVNINNIYFTTIFKYLHLNTEGNVLENVYNILYNNRRA